MALLYNLFNSWFHKRKGAVNLEHSNLSKIIKNLSNVDLYLRFEDTKI